MPDYLSFNVVENIHEEGCISRVLVKLMPTNKGKFG